jgi:hypothetical protein
MNTFQRVLAPAGALTLFIATLLPGQALACSTCKCGDNTLTLLGSEKAYGGRFRVGVDVLLRSESSGEPGVDEQATDEVRTTLGLAYSLSPDLTVALQIPLVRKEIQAANLAQQKASGLGDIDLAGRWVLVRSGGLSGRHLAGLRAGVRLPTAAEVEDGDGELLDIDVQPDAGATAPNIGGWYGYYRFPWFATVSATYFTFSEGHQEFQAGDAGLYSALAQYGLSQNLALQLGLDARQSRRNRFSGVADPDSGGLLTMAFVGAAVRFGPDLLLHGGVQLPLIENMNGVQDEDPNFRVGLTYDF